MTLTVGTAPAPKRDDLTTAATRPCSDVLADLGVDDKRGLTSDEVAARRARFGPNAVTSHRVRFWQVLWHQVRSPLLALLLVTALASYFLGERTDAVIIAVIVTLSVGLGFGNEYRAARSAQALRSQIRHTAVVVRDGAGTEVDVVDLVPGDLVEVKLGDVVPADLRLAETVGLECDESVLTGESLPVVKSVDAVMGHPALADLSSCALMGTVVHAGTGRGVVVATGRNTEFGKIAAGLTSHQLETEFQVGLRRFSMLLVDVAGVLTASIFIANVLLHRSVLDSLLFSLAIAVGITPQLLPAVVSTSLAAGSRRLARRKVLVKRLVCIEDLGDVGTLFTDKTGTLTIGHIQFMRAVPAPGRTNAQVLRWALLATENAAGGIASNPLDHALWESPAAVEQRAALDGVSIVGVLPFDHERMLSSAIIRERGGKTVQITKGAPEVLLGRCDSVPPQTRTALQAEFDAGNRVIAVATRSGVAERAPRSVDENGLQLQGFLVFLDPPRPDARESLARLTALGVAVKVVTGDNPAVAAKVCSELGLDQRNTLTGADISVLDDDALIAAMPTTTVFARVTPEDKARIVRLQRRGGTGVAFLGDGVNDALALHAADVGISVETATDVAKEAADVILLEKSLAVLADGVAEGRRIFANTMKYVLMGTSSNFGNMFSAAGASLFLPFLPMLPSQILLNNLLYDTSQLAIPTDNVDPEQLQRPSHWDVAQIRRFMLTFGPLSSVFDFATFGIMLWVFHAGAAEFRSGWFVESLATQTLIIFAIRTRRVPFLRSRPSVPLAVSALTVVAVGCILPASPVAGTLGFGALPAGFFAALVAMVMLYLVLVELVKQRFYRSRRPAAPARPSRRRRLRRRAARFSSSASRI